MTIRDIVEAIEQFAPLSIQEGWDNSGLCIGAPGDEAWRRAAIWSSPIIR